MVWHPGDQQVAKVRGWLYVSQNSAKFVSDEQIILSEDINWQKLVDKENLEKFLNAFEPLRKEEHSSTQSYYIEFSLKELSAWFEQ